MLYINSYLKVCDKSIVVYLTCTKLKISVVKSSIYCVESFKCIVLLFSSWALQKIFCISRYAAFVRVVDILLHVGPTVWL